MHSAWWIFATGWCALLPATAAVPPQPGAPQAAVWREQRLDFAYPGRTVRYSCDGLREKLRGILLELGARRDLSVDAAGCDQHAPHLKLEFSTPVLPDA